MVIFKERKGVEFNRVTCQLRLKKNLTSLTVLFPPDLRHLLRPWQAEGETNVMGQGSEKEKGGETAGLRGDIESIIVSFTRVAS